MIIESLLDNDLYTFTVGQIALHQFPTFEVEYAFKCRTGVTWTVDMIDKIEEELNKFCNLRFTSDELSYLTSLRFFKKSYIDFLRLYRPNYDHINIELRDGELFIKIIGPWFLTIYFEVPVLSIVQEVFFKFSKSGVWTAQNWLNGAKNLNNKVDLIKRHDLPLADFGGRRRIAAHWHDTVVKRLKDCPSFIGTSNVHLAKKYDIKCIGTMSHQLFMVGQGRDDVPLGNSQKAMLQSWVDEYRGDLGIALSDTVGIDAFLRDFDPYFAKLYDGLRQDSGDPYVWTEKVLKHYETLKIDPRTKSLVYSDGLNILKALDIFEAYKDKAKVSFGIGTNLTNDFDGIMPLQNVIKLVYVNKKPVAKISDSKGKGMCLDSEFEHYLRKVFHIQ